MSTAVVSAKGCVLAVLNVFMGVSVTSHNNFKCHILLFLYASLFEGTNKALWGPHALGIFLSVAFFSGPATKRGINASAAFTQFPLSRTYSL